MKLNIQLNLSDLSLSNNIFALEAVGVKRAQPTVRKWIYKADLKHNSDKRPGQGAVDDTVIHPMTTNIGCALLL
jgi:hypothetical protein